MARDTTKSVLLAATMVLTTLLGTAPVQAQNTNTTIQEGKININRTFQYGDNNENATYQTGKININRTIQLGGNSGNQTGQFGSVNSNRTHQSREYKSAGLKHVGLKPGESRHRGPKLRKNHE